MSPPQQLRQRTSNCSSLLIYRPRNDERLSWPSYRWGPSSPSVKGAQLPIFGPYLLWPNGWMDQAATWYEGRLRPRPDCVTWRPSSNPLPPKKGTAPIFGPCLLWPNGRPSQLLLSTCYRYYRLSDYRVFTLLS